MMFSFSANGKRYIVTFKDKGTFSLMQARVAGEGPTPSHISRMAQLMRVGVQPVEVLDHLGIIIVDVDTDDPQTLEKLKSHPHVVVEEDVAIPTPSPFPFYAGYIEADGGDSADDEVFVAPERPWGLDRIDTPKAWEETRGEGARVLVLDSGIDKDHPEFAGRFEKGRSFIFGTFNSLPYPYFDETGHGTHVSGTALGQFVGVAPGARLLMGKVCNPSSCPSSAIVAGINWGIEEKVDVINMSLGGMFPAVSYSRALMEAERAGCCPCCRLG